MQAQQDLLLLFHLLDVASQRQSDILGLRKLA